MSDSEESLPELPPLEPRFRIEANSWEELLEQLKSIAPTNQEIVFRAQRDDTPVPPAAVEPPQRQGHLDLVDLADTLTSRLNESVIPVDREEPPDYNLSGWQPRSRSEPGDVRRRHQNRRQRRLLIEAGYVFLYDAMMARELTDRELAVKELENTGDVARLERLAEHSPHRVTRRSALDSLARLKAIHALEAAALYIRPEIYAPKKQAPAPEEGGVAHHLPEFHDDTRDHAVDLLARLNDEGMPEALNSLKRVVQYDFSRDTISRLRAIRRLGERIDELERRKDWDGLSMIYRESLNATIRRQVTDVLSRHIEELEKDGEVDALLAVADLRIDLRDHAENAVRRIEKSPSPEREA